MIDAFVAAREVDAKMTRTRIITITRNPDFTFTLRESDLRKGHEPLAESATFATFNALMDFAAARHIEMPTTLKRA